MQVIQYIVDLGPSVMLPIVIFIIGVILGRGIGKSIVSGLTIGVGFVGIGLVVGLLTSSLGPAAEEMAKNFNVGLSVVDVGWPGSSPMAWASTMGLIAIPVAVLTNIVMLLTRLTRVVNVDIWNIWHFAFTGAIVQIATGNYWWAILAIVVHSAFAYKLGDMWGQATDGHFGLTGVAIPHGTSAYMGILAKPIDDLIEAIPGLNRVNVTTARVEKVLGPFGQPIVIGTILGLVVGLLAGYDIGQALQLGVSMGAVMLLMPMVVKLIMQGLMPIADAAKKTLQKRFKSDDYRIGLDPALLLGDPQVVSAGILFVPLTIVIAAVMPGNQVLPFGDLATIGFFIAMAVAVHSGNIFRTLISGSVIIAITLWVSNQMIDLHTQLAKNVGLLGDASRLSSLDQGGAPITYLLANGINLDVGIGFFLLLLAYVGSFIYTFIAYRRGHIYRPAYTNDAETGTVK